MFSALSPTYFSLQKGQRSPATPLDCTTATRPQTICSNENVDLKNDPNKLQRPVVHRTHTELSVRRRFGDTTSSLFLLLSVKPHLSMLIFTLNDFCFKCQSKTVFEKKNRNIGALFPTFHLHCKKMSARPRHRQIKKT